MNVSFDIPDVEHAAIMRRIEGLQAKQRAQAGGEVPTNQRIGIAEYFRTLARADLTEHFRRLEATARARAAQAVSGDTVRVAA